MTDPAAVVWRQAPRWESPLYQLVEDHFETLFQVHEHDPLFVSRAPP